MMREQSLFIEDKIPDIDFIKVSEKKFYLTSTKVTSKCHLKHMDLVLFPSINLF